MFSFIAAGCGSTPDVPAAKKQQVTVRPVKRAALVVFAGKEVTKRQAAVVRNGLARQLVRRYDLELLWGAEFEAALAGRDKGRAGGKCGASIDEFAMAVDRLQLGKAAGLKAQIEKNLPACGPWLDRNTLVKLFTTSARLALTAGRKTEAEETLRRLVTVHPKLDPAAAGIEGGLVGPFLAAKSQVLSGLAHPLLVTSDPGGAQVWADGHAACRTPCRLELYSGMHFLRAELDGYTTWTLTLKGGVPPEQLSVKLLPVYHGEATAVLGEGLFEQSGDAAMLGRLAELAGFYGVGGLVLVRLGKDGDTLWSSTRLFFARERALTWPLKVSMGTTPAAWRATTRSLAASLKALAKPKRGGHKKMTRRRRKGKRKRR